MVKHLQAIRQLLPTNCLSVFDQFMGLVLEKLKMVMLKLAKKKKINDDTNDLCYSSWNEQKSEQN